MKKLILVVALMAVIAISGCVKLDQTPQIEDLQSRLSAAEQRIAYLEQQEAQRLENDKIVLLRDAHGFVANGIVDLGPQVEVREIKVVDSDGKPLPSKYEYTLNGATGLLDESTQVWYPIDVHNGEVVYLMTYSKAGGPKYIAYYTCYTNSTTCYVDTKVTPILAMSE